jgi:hypothetical protein
VFYFLLSVTAMCIHVTAMCIQKYIMKNLLDYSLFEDVCSSWWLRDVCTISNCHICSK